MPKNHTADAPRGYAGKGTSTLDLATEWKVNGHKHNALHVKKMLHCLTDRHQNL